MKVLVTIVVEPEHTGWRRDYRDRFIVEAGTAPVEEIAQNVQVAAYNMVEELVQKARKIKSRKIDEWDPRVPGRYV